jgi:hypothetical protein
VPADAWPSVCRCMGILRLCRSGGCRCRGAHPLLEEGVAMSVGTMLSEPT